MKYSPKPPYHHTYLTHPYPSPGTGSTSVAISTEDRLDSTRRVRIFDGTTLEFKSMGRSEDGSGKVLANMLHDHDHNTALTMLAWAGDSTSNLMACMQRKGKKGRNDLF